jgi:hypothetical protein
VLRSKATADEQPAINRMAGQLLILALLTQLVYPLLYDSYLGWHGQPMTIIATIVTAIRNLALVAFTVEACWLAWRMLGASISERPALTRRD